jgi:hypothetical protein
MNLAADDPLARIDVAGFVDGLQELGWKPGGTYRSLIAGVPVMQTFIANTRRS